VRQILHVSDVHFGPPHRPAAAAAATALVAERCPDLVVISGDLTQRAKPEQFRQARAWVDQLGVPSLTVPGNHDVPMYRAWERALAPYGAYRRWFSEELEPTFSDDELHVIGVNSAYNWTTKHGRITRRRLASLSAELAAAPPRRCKIIVVHHPLIPPPNFGLQRVTLHAQEAMELFSATGVELVLSGHEHQSYWGRSEDFYTFGRRPVLLLTSGTSTSTRGRRAERGLSTCNWIRIEEAAITIDHLRFEPEAQRFEPTSSHRFPRPSPSGP
jgi:3',5'-cyclic AMP phosphodiesterase CpdA